MNSQRLDGLARVLSTAGSRRGALSALFGSLVSLLTLGAAPSQTDAKKKQRKKRRRKVTGPCAQGKSKHNSCDRDSQCCTDYCRKRRCRCRNLHQSCTAEANCCPRQTGLTCLDGTCQDALSCASHCPDGCCDGVTCLPGTSNAACGTGGATCQACRSDEHCVAGTCKLRPCAERCQNGCCDGQTCITDTSNDACGTGGAPCQTCSETTPVCHGGACACDVCASGCPFSSVQAAIDAANSGATIQLCAGSYDETLSIAKNVTVIGAGERRTRLSGSQENVVVLVNEGANVTLESLRITGGSVHGVEVESATLALTDCSVLQNGESSDGGGLFIHGTASEAMLTRCTVFENQGGNGANIYNSGGNLTLDSTVVASGTAGPIGGSNGAGIYLTNGTVTLKNSSGVISNTTNGGNGGGIYTENGTVILFDNCSVTHNDVLDGDGVDGGGIYSLQSNVTLHDDSRVCGNLPDQCAGFTDPACQQDCPA